MEKKRSFHGQSLWKSKLLKVMKLTVLLMLISLMGVFASETYSQTTRLTLNANKMSLEDFLVKIENQSEFRFFYTGKIDVEQEVSGEFRNKKIFEVLDEIKEEAGFQYEVLGRQIILSPNNAEGAIKSIQQQKTVSGKVTDSSGQPLPGVTVVVKGTTREQLPMPMETTHLLIFLKMQFCSFRLWG
jgi:TonB-dependent starch-binding outer membrane protein SusC